MEKPRPGPQSSSPHTLPDGSADEPCGDGARVRAQESLFREQAGCLPLEQAHTLREEASLHPRGPAFLFLLNYLC